jgi:hypothetical protein
MKAPRLILSLLALTSASSLSQGAAITQTFESGEDTSNWGPGSVWQGGSTIATFLDPSFGGASAGAGSSALQNFSRVFRDNTVGIDVTTAYTISLYAEVALFENPANGQFEVMDGNLGANTAHVRIRTEDEGGGTFSFHWEAKNGGAWDDMGLEFLVGQPYHIEFAIDPEALTYTPTISLVSQTGTVLDTSSLADPDLSFDQSVVTNGQNGELHFYLQGSAGSVGAAVDNINITNIPEPALPGIIASATLALGLRRRRMSAV